MKKTIGILAHVDSGKTTLSEQILYNTKSIRTCGRVDHKDSYLDNSDIERKRGITVFSEQAIFKVGDSKYYLIDTPGHIDFCTEMERTLDVLDYGILLISAADGVQSYTKTLFKLLRNKRIPILIFINKIDRVGVDIPKIINNIKKELFNDVILIDSNIVNDGFSDKNIEEIAELDEDLLEKYFDDKYDEKLWISTFSKKISENKCIPVFTGSALQNMKIEDFISNLDVLTETNYNNINDDFIGKVFKIRYDEKGNRITFIKILQGSLKAKDIIKYAGKEDEKVNAVYSFNGPKAALKDIAYCGDIVGVLGLKNTKTGDILGKNEGSEEYEIEPSLTSKVIYDKKQYNPKEVLKCFKILEDEDPSLNVTWSEEFQDINICIMGKIQLEVLKEVINNRFNISVEFGPCEILYKETIEKSVIGIGHFEPLRHYAEVVLKLEPIERNKGIEFESICHTDYLSYSTQNLVKTHVFEKVHKGILTGFPITDIKVTLISGRTHVKHTSGGDFREAVYRAIRQGLECSDNVLLEPYYKFEISVPSDMLGRVISDIQRLKGTFEDPEMNGNDVIINGRGSVREFMDYGSEIMAYTKGMGSISFYYDGYDICHDTEEVIKKINYNKDADKDNLSSSIFCSKGEAFVVQWNEVKEHSHCIKYQEINI